MPEDTPAPKPAEAVIDATADLETREAQAKEYLFSIIDEDGDAPPPPPQDHTSDDTGNKDDQTPADDGKKERASAGELTRRARQEKRRAESERRELQSRLEALSGKDPIALLDELGLDKADIVDKILLDGRSPSDIGEGASAPNKELLERVQRLEQELRAKEQGGERGEAIKAINGEISEDSHFWLHQEDAPAELVLQYLTTEYEKDPHSGMTVDEAAEICEKFYADRAKKIQEASQKRKKGDEDLAPADDGAPPRNLQNAGGSASQSPWDKLPVEEREKHAISELRQSLRSRG